MFKLLFSPLVIGLLLVTSSVQAELVQQFGLGSSDSGSQTISGVTFTNTFTGLSDNGVTFDATVTVTGSDTLNQTGTTGLGVESPGDSSNLLNANESLIFAISVENVVGGTLDFGFSSLTLSSLASAGEQGFLSLDNTLDNPGDIVLTDNGAHDVSTLLGSTMNFTLFGFTDSSFRADSVRVSFVGTQVIPEPMTAATFVLGLGLIARRRR